MSKYKHINKIINHISIRPEQIVAFPRENWLIRLIATFGILVAFNNNTVLKCYCKISYFENK